MRIGINALFEPRGGSFEHLRGILAAWELLTIEGDHEVVVFAGPFATERIRAALPPSIRLVRSPALAKGLLLRLVFEQTWLPAKVRRQGVDVLLCPGNTVPLLAHIPSVAILQNAAPFCERVHWQVTGLRSRVRTTVLGLAIRLSARRASKVIFISQHFRDLFESRFGFRQDKGVVIHRARLAPMPARSSSPPPPPPPALGSAQFILSVSHLYPYKNILELIEGYRLMTRAVPDWHGKLVIVGASYLTNYATRIKQLIDALHFQPGEVILTGELPHDDVANLMRNCQAFAFSSTCENCPTALLEALSAPAAIACSNVGVMPEIGGDAVLYFSPYEPATIAGALGRIVVDRSLQQSLREAAWEQSQRFPDHPDVARRTLEVLLEVAGTSQGK